MPIIPKLQDDPSVNAWTDQVTLELNEARDTIEELRSLIAALTARIEVLEP